MSMKTAIKRLFGEEFNSLLLLNLLMALCCIPVVTIGPALLALNGTFIRILEGTCDRSRTKEFRCLLREKFWAGLCLEAAFLAYGFVLVMAVAMADALPGRSVLYMVAGAAGILFLMLGLCVTMILAAARMRFTRAVAKGITMMLGRLPQVLLGTLVVYGLLFVCYLFYPISVVPMMVLVLSCVAALAVGILWPAVCELLLSGEEESVDKNN